MKYINRINGGKRTGLTFGVILCALVWAVPVLGQVRHNGVLDRVGPFRVLRVWGTAREMGFAHGYLLADDIVADVQTIIGGMFGSDKEAYEQALKIVAEHVRCPGWTELEIESIHDGVSQRLGDAPMLEVVGRKLKVEDLIFFNAFDAMRAFGCSGFAVWDQYAGEAGVMAARNFDFTAFTPDMLGRQMILVRQPKGGKQVASITWPGYIGVFTGFNEDGVALFLHDGTGRRTNAPERKYMPLGLVLAGFLEEAEGNIAPKVRNLLIPLVSPFSYIVRVVLPRTAEVSQPVFVYHIDADGAGFSPHYAGKSVTTNHYLNEQFEPRGETGEDSIRRYNTIVEKLNINEVSSALAWEILDSVAFDTPECGTIHSLVIYPERRRVELSFATWKEQYVPATKTERALIAFKDLFVPPPPESKGTDRTEARDDETSSE